ncbi:ABC transporter ATP-binding protein [candidate division KSB1 bacterium]|nr:ABC transporter ATP-binding protein [candidate division KSB1 bacterium]
MADSVIQTVSLSKVYKGELEHKPVTALVDLNLEVQRGEVYAFLGPNGAGKSTTIKLLTRLIFPSTGTITIQGKDIRDRYALDRIGFMPEQPNLYGYLSGREFLDYVGAIFRMSRSVRKERAIELLQLVGLEKGGERAIRGYSRGMTQRLALAQALMNDPDLLILDEPMSNLDPIGRKDVRDIILNLKEEGKTIFFSSHILSDAEMIADRIGILNEGRLVQVGTMSKLVDKQIVSTEVTFEIAPEKLSSIIQKDLTPVQQENRVMVRLSDESQLSELLESVNQSGGKIISVIPQRKSLEEYFIAQLGRN